MNDKTGNNKIGNIKNPKKLYAILILIAITLALTTKFISDNDFSRLSLEDEYTHSQYNFPSLNFTEPENEADANEEVTGVKDTRQVETEKVPESTKGTTVPATSFKAEEPYKGRFDLPLGGAISKGYSDFIPVYSATMKDWRVHNAVDFAGVKGDRVAAISPGKVEAVYEDPLYGTVAVIDHGNGISAYYCGLSAEGCVEVGDIVEASDTVGYLDTVPCEQEDGAEHLHFEITVNGKKVNPLEVMGKAE
ncbi:MAG TPA: M23 family metallopeptidase [Oscillospiraceae bacterium]|nr:M23 family metallopeptidase [Oscillospiraceae bacterium]